MRARRPRRIARSRERLRYETVPSGQSPYRLLGLATPYSYRFRAELDWTALPVANIAWVMTKNYHPRYRVHYQARDSLLGLECVFRDEDTNEPVCGSWYFYALKARSVHFRMSWILRAVRNGAWAHGAFWIALPDRTVYLFNRAYLQRYEAYPLDADAWYLTVYLKTVQRCFGWRCNTNELSRFRELAHQSEPDWITRYDQTNRYDWQTVTRRAGTDPTIGSTRAAHDAVGEEMAD